MPAGTGSTGVPMERSTTPPGCALAVALTSASESQGKSGSATAAHSPCGGSALMNAGSCAVLPTLDAPPGEPSSSKKSTLALV